jgi:hypothetical protein
MEILFILLCKFIIEQLKVNVNLIKQLIVRRDTQRSYYSIQYYTEPFSVPRGDNYFFAKYLNLWLYQWQESG